MVNTHDIRRAANRMTDVEERGESFEFRRDGRLFVNPYLERVVPSKPRVPRYDQFAFRVATADDKEALLLGEPDVFFTTDHYDGWAFVLVRLDRIDEVRLQELLDDAWDAAPLSAKLKRPV